MSVKDGEEIIKHIKIINLLTSLSAIQRFKCQSHYQDKLFFGFLFASSPMMSRCSFARPTTFQTQSHIPLNKTHMRAARGDKIWDIKKRRSI